MRPRSERGSVVLAITVVMLILLLASALLLRSQSQLVATGGATDAAAAEAGAEQGIAEAVALLDSGARGDFAGSGSLIDGTYEFRVTEVSATEYLVLAQATVRDSDRAIEATVTGDVGPTSDEDYSLMIGASGEFGDNLWPITGLVGTNGPLDASTSTPPGDRVDLFGPRASCVGCSSTTSFPEARDLPQPELPATGRSCPKNGRISGVIDGRNGEPFLCSDANVNPRWVTFTNTITVTNPPLIVYVTSGKDVRFQGASVNTGGESAGFQLYAEGTADTLDARNSEIVGVLYGPGRDSVMENVELTGSLTVDTFEIRKGSDVAITPSTTSTGSTAEGWTVTWWERVAAP